MKFVHAICAWVVIAMGSTRAAPNIVLLISRKYPSGLISQISGIRYFDNWQF